MGEKILIFCENEIQAQKLDKFLWKRNPYRFIPHNLTKKGPCYKFPIELCWIQTYKNTKRYILINLQIIFSKFLIQFEEIYDFVPNNEKLKKLARERYKNYRKFKFNLKIKNIENN